jgi:hypothetical protein
MPRRTSSLSFALSLSTILLALWQRRTWKTRSLKSRAILRAADFSPASHKPAFVETFGGGSLVSGSANRDCDARTSFIAGGGQRDGNAIGLSDPDSRLDLFLANSLASLGASHYQVTNFGGRVDQLAGRA